MMTTIFTSLITTVLAYVALEFTGKPVRRFFDLRSEAARQLALFDNVSARFQESHDRPGQREVRELSEQEKERLREAEISLRELASRMRAFVQTESFAVRIIKFFRYKPYEASAELFGLSGDIGTFGPSRAFRKDAIAKALRLKQGEE